MKWREHGRSRTTYEKNFNIIGNVGAFVVIERKEKLRKSKYVLGENSGQEI